MEATLCMFLSLNSAGTLCTAHSGLDPHGESRYLERSPILELCCIRMWATSRGLPCLQVPPDHQPRVSCTVALTTFSVSFKNWSLRIQRGKHLRSCFSVYPCPCRSLQGWKGEGWGWKVSAHISPSHLFCSQSIPPWLDLLWGQHPD